MSRSLIGLAVLAAHMALASTVVWADADPPVPPGRDSGGLAVALIGEGLDYTKPQLAAHLARDGEGEMIGFDFIDQDRRPFAAEMPRGLTEAATIILQADTSLKPSTSLIAVRADVSDVASLAQALEFAGKTPARIIVITGSATARTQRALLVAAAKLFPDKFFIVAAGDGGFDLDPMTLESERDIANLVVATAVMIDGTAAPAANFGATSVDLAVALAAGTETTTAIAAAHVATLAASLFRSAPDINVADAKAHLASLATRWPTNPAANEKNVTRSGWIANSDLERPKQN